jgi:hypothetical protein
MILLVLVALVGASVTFMALLSHGFLLALIVAPFGGSTLAALAGGLLALRNPGPFDDTDDAGSNGPDEQTATFWSAENRHGFAAQSAGSR